MSLWTREEAYDFLNDRFYMEEMDTDLREQMIDDLCAMKHRP